jgi:hypothetical protein
LPAACLSVSDNGSGIKDRHLPSIFEPFFTTKPMNKGSGLGLYNARLFVERHEGAISVETAEGAGTTFRLWLPLADFTEADAARERFKRQRRRLLLAGAPGESLDCTAEILRQHDFHVHAVADVAETEDVLRSPEQSFDGVLVLLEPRDSRWLPLLRFIRQEKLPVKVILQTVGCNPDEVETQFVARADLVIPADLAQESILKRLAELFDAP